MTSETCPNCDTPLNGQYCSNYGQRQGRYDQVFTQLIGEALGDLFRPDARVTKTLLSLCFRPGQLIDEFLAGARSRYVSPVRLYLVASILLFLLFTIGPDERSKQVDQADHAELHDDIMKINFDGANGPLTQYVQEQAFKIAALVESNPQLLFDQYIDVLATIMFFLLPIFALFVTLFYRKSHFFYIEHLIVCVHLQSFIYMALSLLLVLGFLGTKYVLWVEYAIQLWIPIYIFMSLRVVYQQNYALTIFKYVILATVYFSLCLMALLANFIWQVTAL